METRGKVATVAGCDTEMPTSPLVWSARPVPPRTPMEGRWARLEPFSVEAHAGDLFAALAEDREGDLWRFRYVGPFVDEAAFLAYARVELIADDPLYFTIIDRAGGRVLGAAAYMRITPAHGVIEVGSIVYAPHLQRTRVATDAMYLMACRAFDELGYRRYEWKCDDRNQSSKRAALRLGFAFEGVFRNHMVVKGRSRDTAWFAMTDADWPAIRANLEAWLAPDNFDGDGRQKTRLSEMAQRENA